MVRLQPSASKCVLLPLLGHRVDGGCGELSRGDHKAGVVRGQSRRFFDVRRDCPICVRSASMPFNCYRSKNSPPSTASATNGVDYFSPEMLYEAGTDAELAPYAATVNWLLGSLGQPALGMHVLRPGISQLKCLIDLAHLHGIPVLFDLVYNHEGGDFGDAPIRKRWLGRCFRCGSRWLRELRHNHDPRERRTVPRVGVKSRVYFLRHLAVHAELADSRLSTRSGRS
jgi:hypothetical protein